MRSACPRNAYRSLLACADASAISILPPHSYLVLYFVFMLLIYVYGAALGYGTNSLPMFTRSQPGVIVVFDLLFINVQVATAFLFQALFSNAKTATVGCVRALVMDIAALLRVLTQAPYSFRFRRLCMY